MIRRPAHPRLVTRLAPLLAAALIGCVKAPIETGEASWYGKAFRGRPTASGVTFRPSKRTAAHPSLPFGTVLKVTRVDSGESVRVVVNDRGPYAKGRILDLSRRAARRLGLLEAGHTRVELRIVGCRQRYGGCDR